MTDARIGDSPGRDAPATPPAFDAARWEALAFPERFAVWTMRLWLAAFTGDPDAPPQIRVAFENVDAVPAIPLLDRMMRMVADGADRPVRFTPVAIPALSDDEGLLLRALELAQGDGPVDGVLVLRGLLTADACRAFRPACRAFARALADAGLRLPGASAVPPPAADAAPRRLRRGGGLPR